MLCSVCSARVALAEGRGTSIEVVCWVIWYRVAMLCCGSTCLECFFIFCFALRAAWLSAAKDDMTQAFWIRWVAWNDQAAKLDMVVFVWSIYDEPTATNMKWLRLKFKSLCEACFNVGCEFLQYILVIHTPEVLWNCAASSTSRSLWNMWFCLSVACFPPALLHRAQTPCKTPFKSFNLSRHRRESTLQTLKTIYLF